MTDPIRTGSAPTVNDDGTKGFQVGQVWVDTTTKIAYTLTDATTPGAAVWTRPQPYDADLATIGALTPTAGKVLGESGGAWAAVAASAGAAMSIVSDVMNTSDWIIDLVRAT